MSALPVRQALFGDEDSAATTDFRWGGLGDATVVFTPLERRAQPFLGVRPAPHSHLLGVCHVHTVGEHCVPAREEQPWQGFETIRLRLSPVALRLREQLSELRELQPNWDSY